MGEYEENSVEQAVEFERKRALDVIIAEYLDADEEFLDGHDFEDKVGAVYGMLLELGEDPDVILGEAGVLEKENNDEV